MRRWRWRAEEGSNGRWWSQLAVLLWQRLEGQALLWGAPGAFGTRAGEGLVEQCRASSPALRRAIDNVDDLVELYEAVSKLPSVDLSCQLRLPRLSSPELERLRSAITEGDDDEIRQALPEALAQIDNVLVRAELARAVIALRAAGRVSEEVAAAALLDLDSDADALVREALLAALAVDCGVAPTPSGLVLAS